MDFKDTLARFVRPTARPQDQALRAALESARVAKYAEQYDRALQALDRGLVQARAQQDRAAEIALSLHKSEVLIRQGRLDDADSLLQTILKSASTDTQRAYCFCMSGVLKQTRGDWAGARGDYEQAVDLARSDSAAGAEGRALGHLGDTYLQDGNASYAAHLLQDALPKLSSSGDTDLLSYFTGLLGQALIQNGQLAEGQHTLDKALRLAEQVGYRVYQRHWGLVLGSRALEEGRAQDAHAYFNLVLRQFAPETVSTEYVTAVIAISRASHSLRRSDEALAYAQIALTAAQQLGDSALQTHAEATLGVALRAVGRSDEAIPYLQGAAHPEALRSLAAAQADSGDYDAAIASCRRAIQQAESSDRALEVAQARRDLGLVYLRLKDYPAAIAEWAAALSYYDQQRAYAQAARLYCDIGSARKSMGQRARAMKDYAQALMALNSINGGDQETRGLVLSNAANAYAEQGDAESADAFFTEAINIAELLNDKAAESIRCGNYGWFLLLIGRPRRAMATLERALTLSQSLGLTLQAAVQLDNLGLVYDSLGDLPVALEHHRKALAQVSDSALGGADQGQPRFHADRHA